MLPGFALFDDFKLRVSLMLLCLNNLNKTFNFRGFVEYNRENIDKLPPIPIPTNINTAQESRNPNS